jgi:chemotaxis protein MotB
MSTPTAKRRRRRHDEHSEHENHERWLVSYADMITVLMVLFIVLFAMSTIDQTKFWELRASLANSFGHQLAAVQGGQSPTPGDSAPEGPLDSGPIVPGSTDEKNKIDHAIRLAKSQEAMAQAEQTQQAVTAAVKALEKVRRAIEAALRGTDAEHSVKFRYDERGLVVSVITDSVLFAPDRAELTPAGARILDLLAPALRAVSNQLHVEGHTNTVPVAPKYYPSEWELSSARAAAVVRRLVGLGIDPHRLSATGYGDTRPLLAGTGAEANRVNRRVEIVVASDLPPEQRALIGSIAPVIATDLNTPGTPDVKETTP